MDCLRVAVITPTVPGREEVLERCRESVVRAAALVVDQGGEYVHEVALDEEKVGPAKMRNRIVAGLDWEPDWLLLLDDDDEIDEDYFTVLCPALARNDVVAGWFRTIDHPTDPHWTVNRLFRPEAILRGPNMLPVTAMIRRTAWEDVGGMQHVPMEDHDLWIRMLKAGKRFEVVPEVVWTFHFHGGQHFSRPQDLVDA